MSLIPTLGDNSFVTQKQLLHALNSDYTGGNSFQTKALILNDGHFVIANQQAYKDSDFVCNKDLSIKGPEITDVNLLITFDRGNIPTTVDMSNYQMRITNVRSKNDGLVIGATYSCKYPQTLKVKSDTDFDYTIESISNAIVPDVIVNKLILQDIEYNNVDVYKINLNLLDNCPSNVIASIYLKLLQIIYDYSLLLNFQVSPGTGNLNLNTTFFKIGLIETGGFSAYIIGDIIYCNNMHDLECMHGTTFYFSLGDNNGNNVELDYALLDGKRITDNKVIIPDNGFSSTLEVFIKGTW